MPQKQKKPLHKYVAVLVIDSFEKVTKKEVRESLLAALGDDDMVGFMYLKEQQVKAVRVRSVDID